MCDQEVYTMYWLV